MGFPGFLFTKRKQIKDAQWGNKLNNFTKIFCLLMLVIFDGVLRIDVCVNRTRTRVQGQEWRSSH